MPHWALPSSGQFTVASAYEYLRKQETLHLNSISGTWQWAWRWNGPERIRMFLLQCLHNRLLANQERLRRHLSNDLICRQCNLEEESMLHALRDCRMVSTIDNGGSVCIKNGSFQQNCLTEVLKWWAPPTTDWIVLSTDGPYQKSTKQAAAGGVLRDSLGQWRGGYTMRLRRCTAYWAELWGECRGLKHAWDLGFRRIVLQVDSKIVVQARLN
ncbi:Uncharacterized protein TCM_026608 [Theobroma cacao]|uniref:Uncharacterized protein n=1 Tax=Theobroma cacao TaxID=3641 RepID=A0A061F2Z5_THECC|nr:Uncharacterized protein TCM_026608 [Theobroma cacao]